MGYHGRVDLHAAAHGRAHSRAGGCGLKEIVAHGAPPQEQDLGQRFSLWRGVHSRAGDLVGAAMHRGTTLGQSIPEGRRPVVQTDSGAVLEEL